MARNILTPTVYGKALRIGSNAKLSFSTGKIINLFSIDVFHIQMFFQNFGGEVFAPAQLGAALGLVYREVGVAMFAALGFVVGILPLLMITFILFAKYRRLKNIPGDARVKLTNELLSGIRIIKYYAWEKPFFQSIDALRNCELGYLLRMNLVLVLIVMLITSIPFVLPIVIFYAYTNINNQQLDVGKAFTTLALLGLVSGPMSMIPAFLQRLLQAKISMSRIFEFLSCDELEQYIKYIGPDTSDTDSNSGIAILMQQASLAWVSEQAAATVPAASGGGSDAENRQLNESQVKGEYSSVPNDVVNGKDIELTTKPGNDPLQTNGPELLHRATNTLIDVSISMKQGELVAIIGGVG